MKQRLHIRRAEGVNIQNEIAFGIVSDESVTFPLAEVNMISCKVLSKAYMPMTEKCAKTFRNGVGTSSTESEAVLRNPKIQKIPQNPVLLYWDVEQLSF